MGNKQSYNVADANASIQTVKSSGKKSGDESVESEVAFTYDTSAQGINMKKSNDDEKYVQYEILYRIDPLPHIPIPHPIPDDSAELREPEETIEST